MSIKEYNQDGYCEVHAEKKLFLTGDWNGESWYECKACSDEDGMQFWKFIKETALKVELRPGWKGGDGLGVLCPCCEGNEYVTKEKADDYNRTR